MKDKKRNGPAPEQVIREYESGVRFKAGLGTRGLYEQNRINERFYTGDQWAGARCGEDRPLVRYNLIKRIGEYKMAVIGSTPLAVQYTADGVTLTPEIQKAVGDRRKELSRRGALPPSTLEGFWSGRTDDEEIQLVLSALSGLLPAPRKNGWDWGCCGRRCCATPTAPVPVCCIRGWWIR